MKCPNADCKSNNDSVAGPCEIIYIRYDDDNLKYLYLCSECDNIWKTDDNK